MSSNTLFQSPFGELQLLRRPRRPNEVLQAWDAADHYLLKHLAETPPAPGAQILVVNDRFGSLALALIKAGFQCDSWGDSAVAQLAVNENAQRNDLSPPGLITGTDAITANYDLILYKLPKSHSLMQYQLQILTAACESNGEIIGAAMAKHIDAATINVLNKLVGDARPGLAWKKARLINFPKAPVNSLPENDAKALEVPELGLTLINRANVFSRGKLDRGSRLLLDCYKRLSLPAKPHIADLGCGNGLLGITALTGWPDASVHFFDDSFMAIDSATQNVQRNLPDSAGMTEFTASDCMFNYQGPSFDLVLCNPPFHQEYDLGDQIARQMFADSHRQLKPRGQLCVVGNRHLGYHQILKKRFSHVELIGSDAKFVVLLARR